MKFQSRKILTYQAIDDMEGIDTIWQTGTNVINTPTAYATVESAFMTLNLQVDYQFPTKNPRAEGASGDIAIRRILHRLNDEYLPKLNELEAAIHSGNRQKCFAIVGDIRKDMTEPKDLDWKKINHE